VGREGRPGYGCGPHRPDARMIVVAAPDYLERHPRPQSPADLERHNCVNYRHHSGGGCFNWTLERDGKEVRNRVSGQLILDDPDLAVTLIKAGAGLGMMLEEKGPAPPDVRAACSCPRRVVCHIRRAASLLPQPARLACIASAHRRVEVEAARTPGGWPRG
jgi:hypothetical protein